MSRIILGLVTRYPRIVGIGLCAVAALVYVGLQAAGWDFRWVDENVHLYVAKRVADGAVLYGDIHSARPPMALAPLCILLKLGVPPLAAARLIVISSILGCAAVLVWVGTRLRDRVAGIAAASLFLLSVEAVSRSTFTGIQVVGFFTTLSVGLVLLRRPWLAGAAAGLALAAGQHALIIVGLGGLYLLLSSSRDLGRYLAAGAGTLGAIMAAAVLAGGHGILDDLVGQHLYHVSGGEVAEEGQIGWWILTWLLDNAPLPLISLAGFFVFEDKKKSAGIERKARVGPMALLLILVCAQFVVVATMKGGLVLYLHPALGSLALLAGLATSKLLAALATAAPRAPKRRGARRAAAPTPRSSARVFSVVAAVVIMTATAGAWAWACRRYEKRDSEDYPLLPYLRALQQHELQSTVVADRIASYIRRGIAPGETVFGHPVLAALVAVKTASRVAAELADLAPRWIQMGQIRRESIVEQIENDRVRYFITPRWFYVRDPYFSRYLRTCYETPRVFPRESGPGRGLPDVLVFRHVDSPQPCEPAFAND